MPTAHSGRRAPAWLTAHPIAHRGRHALPYAPENSLAAFAAAIDAGLPIELDVRLLTDGEAAVFHDSDLDRMTGTPGSLETQSAGDIRALRLLGTDQHIPLLPEALAFVAGRVPLLIEIKADASPVGSLEEAALRDLSGYAGEFAVQSFSTTTLSYLAAHAPQVVRGQLASDDRWYVEPTGAQILPQPDFLAYRLNTLPTPLSSALRARGIPLLAWTIQTPEQQRRALTVSDNFIFEGYAPSPTTR